MARGVWRVWGLVAGAGLLFWGLVVHEGSPNPKGTSPSRSNPDGVADAFQRTYLDPLNGIQSNARRQCAECHDATDRFDPVRWSAIQSLAPLSQAQWSAAVHLTGVCGSCHAVPAPVQLPASQWPWVFQRMQEIMPLRGVQRPPPEILQQVLHFYLTFSDRQLPKLPRPSLNTRGELEMAWRRSALGNGLQHGESPRPRMGQVSSASLSAGGPTGVMVCDTGESTVNWIDLGAGAGVERTLLKLPHPARVSVVPGVVVGLNDLLVACLGTMESRDEPLGSVVLARQQAPGEFRPQVIARGLSRVVDAKLADVDSDGLPDVLVAAYGFIQSGEVGWLRNLGDGGYAYHTVKKQSGAVRLIPADLDRDGRVDFVVLFAQEHEEVRAFLNRGQGKFEESALWTARTPAYGCSSMELLDLDGDGDLDVVFTNGDNLDQVRPEPRPFHGVQWLENKGELRFVWHDLARVYGAYTVQAGDLNGDGLPDLVVGTLFNDWSDPSRPSLFWFENLGSSQFRPHAVDVAPTHLISVALVDVDRDGALDIVAGGMHGFPPYDRMGRITWWRNGLRR